VDKELAETVEQHFPEGGKPSAEELLAFKHRYTAAYKAYAGSIWFRLKGWRLSPTSMEDVHHDIFTTAWVKGTRVVPKNLEERGISLDDWTRCDEHYAMALAEDLGHRRMGRAASYAAKCVEEIERRNAQAKPAGGEGGAPPTPASSEPAAGSTPEPPGEAKIGAPLQQPDLTGVPSFLQQYAAPAPPLAPPPAELRATTDVFQLPTALRNGALPFKQGAGPSPLAAPSDPMLRRPPENAGETLSLGGTLPVEVALGAPLAAALAYAGGFPAAPKPPAFPRMPLQTYASLCAELAASSGSVSEILAKYDVADDAAKAALDQHWQARFAAHPSTRDEWARLVAQYREYVQGRRAG